MNTPSESKKDPCSAAVNWLRASTGHSFSAEPSTIKTLKQRTATGHLTSLLVCSHVVKAWGSGGGGEETQGPTGPRWLLFSAHARGGNGRVGDEGWGTSRAHHGGPQESRLHLRFSGCTSLFESSNSATLFSVEARSENLKWEGSELSARRLYFGQLLFSTF